MSDVTRYLWIDLTVHAQFIELFVGKISMLRETVSNVKNDWQPSNEIFHRLLVGSPQGG